MRDTAATLDPTVTRRAFLALVGAAAALAWSAGVSLSQTEVDENGRPIRLPGETPTPETRAREREAIEQQRSRALDDRARQRTLEMQQQQQQNIDAARQRDLDVQRNFEQQRLDILNNRDKP
ncbi:MAG: hypothetical protein ACM30I_15015 [Gemmatimonas sp.]